VVGRGRRGVHGLLKCGCCVFWVTMPGSFNSCRACVVDNVVYIKHTSFNRCLQGTQSGVLGSPQP
jgi:hypothetical protein